MEARGRRVFYIYIRLILEFNAKNYDKEILNMLFPS
jgi:hypothetical protein